MLRFFNNERFGLSFTATHAFLSFAIISSIISFLATQNYSDNPVISGLNLINFIISSFAIGLFLKQKWQNKSLQTSLIWIVIFCVKLLIIPMFIMVISDYGVSLIMNYLLGIIFILMLTDKKSAFYCFLVSIPINIIALQIIRFYFTNDILEQYNTCLQNNAFSLLSVMVKILSILTLLYYRQIELEIKIDSMRTFGNVIAYDMFTPLAVIETTVGLLRQVNEQDREKIIKKLIKTCRSARQNVNFLLQNITFLRNIKSFNNTKCSLQKIVEVCLKEFEENLEIPHKISFVAHNDIVFIGCEKMIRCMIFNILRNALQHSGVDVNIDVMISNNNLIFQDNGCGIKASEIESIFNIFKSSKSHNLGIGLPICKEIITDHGGEINCISLEGNHTTFIVKFHRI
jgi:two-component system CAI-1 autoinducer sensor kinase/phosphatase CqsS